MNYVLLGPPGCGKGTQGAILKKKYGFLHVCAGDLLRIEVEAKSLLGREIGVILQSGHMVGDDVISSLIAEYVKKHEEEGTRNFVKTTYLMDGYPRSVVQANNLDNILATYGKKVQAAFYFHVPHDVLIARISGRLICKDCHAVYHEQLHPPKNFGVCDMCQGTHLLKRNDDNVKILENRLAVFEQKTRPVVDFYEKQGKLFVIHANQAIDSVTCELEQHLARFNKGE